MTNQSGLPPFLRKLLWIAVIFVALWIVAVLTRDPTADQILAKIDDKLADAIDEAKDGDAENARKLLREADSLVYDYRAALASEYMKFNPDYNKGDCRNGGFDATQEVPRGKFLVTQWMVENAIAMHGIEPSEPLTDLKTDAIQFVGAIGGLATYHARACTVAKGMYTGPNDAWMPLLHSLEGDPDFHATEILKRILDGEAEKLKEMQPAPQG